MGVTIRKHVGDTSMLDYQIRGKPAGEDVNRPVDLDKKKVYFVMADAQLRLYDVDDLYKFESVEVRDAYFAVNPSELIDGMVIEVGTIETGITQIRRCSGSWSSITSLVIDGKLCTIVDSTKGLVRVPFTKAEVSIRGMYHVYFRVVDEDSEDLVSVYPKIDSLWIHVMDFFTS